MLHFMPEAAAHVRGATSLDAKTLDAGADRVRASIAGMHPGMGKWRAWSAGRAVGDVVFRGEYMEPEGTASFLAAALLCGKAADRKLMGRWAYVEAQYAVHVLDGMSGGRRESRQALGAVCREVLGADPGRVGASYTLSVPAYLVASVGLGRAWKLVNQDVDGGCVRMGRNRLLRLLRDAVTAYIRNRVAAMTSLWGKSPPPQLDNVRVPEDIARWCASHAETPTSGDMPPCVRGCVDAMNAGKNLSHSGRYLTAVFFIHAGMDDHSIGEWFTGAPDYDPKITSYHISQIRGRGYGVPGCRWVESHRLCPGCDAPHPTKYASK